MKKKQYHLISCGISILTNSHNSGILTKYNLDKNKDDGWNDNKNELLGCLYEEVKSKPEIYSAELKTILMFLRNNNIKDGDKNMFFYLYGTKTVRNQICREIIKKYLEEVKKFHVEDGKEASAEENRNFVEGIKELIDNLVRVAKKKMEEGYEVYINPTGGLKAHVIASSFVASILDVNMYYMNEVFTQLVMLPKMLYYLDEREKKLLNMILEKGKGGPVSSEVDCENVIREYKKEFEKLEEYGYISYETENGKIYRINITKKGKYLLKRQSK